MSIKVNEISNLSQYNQNTQKVSFKANEAPIDTEQKSDTFEKEGLSTEAKVGIGVGALLGLVALGLGIKKGLNVKATNKAAREAAEKATKEAAEKAAKETAEALGIKDVELYKKMQNVFEKVTKHEGDKLEKTDLYNRIDELNKKGLIKAGDKYLILPPKMTQEVFEKIHPGVKLPENSVSVMVESADGKAVTCKELILNNGVGDFIKNMNQDKIHVIHIED